MQQNVGIHPIEVVVRGLRRIDLLPVGHRGRRVFAVEIRHIAHRLALLQQKVAARQVGIPRHSLLRPGNVARVVLAEVAQRHARLVGIVHKRLLVAGMEDDAVDAPRKRLVRQPLQIKRPLPPGHQLRPGGKGLRSRQRLAIDMRGR